MEPAPVPVLPKEMVIQVAFEETVREVPQPLGMAPMRIWSVPPLAGKEALE